MSALMGILLKALFTEAMIKKLIMILGDYLVKSSKNPLDNMDLSRWDIPIEDPNCRRNGKHLRRRESDG